MKMIKLSGGGAGWPIYLNPDSIVAVEKDPAPDATLTLVTTLDGKEKRVQESPDQIAAILENLSS